MNFIDETTIYTSIMKDVFEDLIVKKRDIDELYSLRGESVEYMLDKKCKVKVQEKFDRLISRLDLVKGRKCKSETLNVINRNLNNTVALCIDSSVLYVLIIYIYIVVEEYLKKHDKFEEHGKIQWILNECRNINYNYNIVKCSYNYNIVKCSYNYDIQNIYNKCILNIDSTIFWRDFVRLLWDYLGDIYRYDTPTRKMKADYRKARRIILRDNDSWGIEVKGMKKWIKNLLTGITV